MTFDAFSELFCLISSTFCVFGAKTDSKLVKLGTFETLLQVLSLKLMKNKILKIKTMKNAVVTFEARICLYCIDDFRVFFHVPAFGNKVSVQKYRRFEFSVNISTKKPLKQVKTTENDEKS